MRIGILSSGGDCPGINATIRGVGKTALNYYGMEVIGIHSGFIGLLNQDVEQLNERSLSGILHLGGTILGTSREKPFRKMLASGDQEKPQIILKNYRELGLDCLVCIGGNGTQKTAYLLSQLGLNVIGVPKTIDNDVWNGCHVRIQYGRGYCHGIHRPPAFDSQFTQTGHGGRSDGTPGRMDCTLCRHGGWSRRDSVAGIGLQFGSHQ